MLTALQGKFENRQQAFTECAISNLADRVHVLNPDGVHRAIKHDPFLVWACVSAALPHVSCQHTISPLVSVLIKLSIQLAHSDGLWVEGHHSHFLKAACLIQPCHGLAGETARLGLWYLAFNIVPQLQKMSLLFVIVENS